MAKTKTADMMSKIIYASVTESAANTLTFASINTGYGTIDKVGWIIERLDMWLTNYTTTDSADSTAIAITTSNQITAIDPALSAVKTVITDTFYVITAVGVFIKTYPMTIDYTMLTGGGMIVLPNPLYLACKSTGATVAQTVKARFYVKEVALDPDMWMELVEQTRLLS